MAGSKKSRRKGRKKGKKGKKKSKVVPEPLPLHSLTEIYKKLENLIRHLLDCRVLARKKRIEAWILQEEEISAKRDDAVFKEHISNMLDDVLVELKDISSRLTKERDAIQKEVDRIIAEYQKRLKSTQDLIEIEEKRLEELQTNLKKYETLKSMVRQLEEQLIVMREQYEKIKLEIMIKTTHLRNQYLVMRAELYNYLRDQLANLIAKIRTYILPIVWDHMENEQRTNLCNRWSFKQEDETNTKLLETRENYLKKIERLEWEKHYYGTEWVFSNLNERQHQREIEKKRWKKRLQEIYNQRTLYQTSKKKAVVTVEKSQLRIVADFQIFLQKKLTAITEARQRKERHDRMLTLKKQHGITVKDATPNVKDREDSAVSDLDENSYSTIKSSIAWEGSRIQGDLLNDNEDEVVEEYDGASPKSTKDHINDDKSSNKLSVAMLKAIISGSEGIFAIDE